MYCAELQEIVQEDIIHDIFGSKEDESVQLGGLSLLSPQSLSASLKSKIETLMRKEREVKDVGLPEHYEVIVSSKGSRLKLQDTLA